MPRTRTIPDSQVLAAVRHLLGEGGERAVSFATVAAATGLAPPTLVQRYGSREAMVRAARMAAWDELGNRTTEAISATANKGPQALLKAIGPVDIAAIASDLRDPDLAQRAAAWRATVEAALALRLGTGSKAKEGAALLFAAWQGQALWAAAGDDGFRLKDAVKRLT
ncbi:TetR family transcriptional regulator [Tabrizicola sp. YIM 78059]|uniref:TetR family transcriptional regulator n=1 Tax=Tabrizicola sp. YIM 78059 TaxID=2529861 RepID=UPI0010A9E9D0|nr:TetR family transcriptional regulator [Tabrizicola sp. YIM 78059]